jgi:hypothetical protein
VEKEGANWTGYAIQLRLLLMVLVRAELKSRRNWLRSLRFSGSFYGVSALTIR